MATPYLDEAERCGRVLLLHEGAALAIDAPAVLQGAFTGRLFEVVTATDRPPLDTLLAVAGVSDAQGFGGRAHVTVAPEYDGDVEQDIRAALSREQHEVVSVRPITPTLEDVFIEMLSAK
jgi:ABC-2 type transport system ATP-binding protein